MTFVLKQLLHRLISSYLDLTHPINLDKGEVQLPAGHLNHSNVNKMLREKGMKAKVVYSEYGGLAVGVPITGMLSRPIGVRVEIVRVVVVVGESEGRGEGEGGSEGNSRSDSSELRDSESINSSESTPTKQPPQKSYLQSILHRLLTNMQIQIKHFQLTLRPPNNHPYPYQHIITLQGLQIKNSISLLEANLLKKIICMTGLMVTMESIGDKDDEDKSVNEGEEKGNGREGIESKENKIVMLQIGDLNMSVNIDYTRMSMICLLDRIRLAIRSDTVVWLSDKLGLKQKYINKINDGSRRVTTTTTATLNTSRVRTTENNKQQKQTNSYKRPDLEALQLKLTHIQLSLLDTHNSQLLHLSIHSLQLNKQKPNTITVPIQIQTNIKVQEIRLSTRVNTGKEGRREVIAEMKSMAGMAKNRGGETMRGSREGCRLRVVKAGGVGRVDVENVAVVVGCGVGVVRKLGAMAQGLGQRVEKWVKFVTEQHSQVQIPSIQETDLNIPEVNQPSSFPSLHLTNISLQLLHPTALHLHIPQTLTLAHTHTHSHTYTHINKYNLSLPLLYIKLNPQHDNLLKINDMKIGFSNEEIVTCVDGLQMGIDVGEVRRVLGELGDGQYMMELMMMKQQIRKLVTVATQLVPQSRTRSQRNPQPKLYLRIPSLTLALGSHFPLATPTTYIFIPIFLLSITSLKLHHNTTTLQLKTTIISLIGTSVSNLSYSPILKQPINMQICVRFGIRGERGQEGERVIEGCNVQIKSSVVIVVQEEHVGLLAVLLRCMKGQGGVWMMVENKTDEVVTIGVGESEREGEGEGQEVTSLSQLVEPKEQSNKDKQKEIIRSKDKSKDKIKNMQQATSRPLMQYTLAKNQKQPVILYSKGLRVRVQGTWSHMIWLDGDSTTTQEQKVSERQFPASQGSVPSNNELSQQLKSMQRPPPLAKNTPGHSPTPITTPYSTPFSTSTPLSPSSPSTPTPSSPYLSQHPIILSLSSQNQPKYLLQLRHNHARLTLTINYRHVLHIFDQLVSLSMGQDGDCILKVEIRSIKGNKCYRWQGDSSSGNRQLFMDNQLLQQQTAMNLTVLITTISNTKQYILKKLLTNSHKYTLYGLYTTTTTPVYYILDPTPQPPTPSPSSLYMHNYYLMPLLIIKNSLPSTHIHLTITNKKIPAQIQYSIAPGADLVPIDEGFDYYMKQFMIRLRCQDQEGVYESQEHYFNTFFMIAEDFENVIELRHTVTGANKKRYIRLKQLLVHKSKVLQFQPCLQLHNKTEHNFDLAYMQALGRTLAMGQGGRGEKVRVGAGEMMGTLLRLKKDDRLVVSCEGVEGSGVEVQVGRVMEAKGVLAYNFCRVKVGGGDEKNETSPKKEEKKEKEKYMQILVKVEFLQESHAQTLVLSPLLYFVNLSKQPLTLSYLSNHSLPAFNPSNPSAPIPRIPLLLPSTTNPEYNNKFLTLHTDTIYQDLLVSHKNWLTEHDPPYLQLHPKGNKIFLHELIRQKIVQSEQNVYSLVKCTKNQQIQLVFSDGLYSTNGSLQYFVFNNCSQQHFLMSYCQAEYKRCLLYGWQGEGKRPLHQKLDRTQSLAIESFTPTQDTTIQPSRKPQELPEILASQPDKCYLQPSPDHPLSIMLNKHKHDLFLCDSNYHKLEPVTLAKLERLKLRQEKYHIENFTVVNIEAIDGRQQRGSTDGNCVNSNGSNNKVEIVTGSILIKLISRRKNIGLGLEIRSIGIRHSQESKMDVLVRDIGVSVMSGLTSGGSERKLSQVYQVLRIPEQSYLLIQGKIFENKLILLKNLYLKCKIIDLTINQPLLTFLTYFSTYIQTLTQLLPSTPAPQTSPQLQKLITLTKQKFLLIRSLHLHPINLCLTVQTTPALDFSNVITLPEYTIANRCIRLGAVVKEISNQYVTNVIAKFPKLSFVYQNLRNPVGMIRALWEARGVLKENGGQRERARVLWSCCYIDMERKFYHPPHPNKPRKLLACFTPFQSLKQDPQTSPLVTHLQHLALTLYHLPIDQPLLLTLPTPTSSNLTTLSSITNIPLFYFLTSKNIHIFTPVTNLNDQCVSLREIESIKWSRFDMKRGELVIGLRRRGEGFRVVGGWGYCGRVLARLGDQLI